ncbi:MAG: hypothetical protein QXY06_04010 [Zestosphaera sp.]
MWVCGEDSSGWAPKARMWGFPHSNEPDEGELWVGATLKGMETYDAGTDERCSEVYEAKGQYQPT